MAVMQKLGGTGNVLLRWSAVNHNRQPVVPRPAALCPGHAGPLAGTLPTFVTTAACAVHLRRRNAAKHLYLDDPTQHEQLQAERVLSYDMVGVGHPDFFTPLT